MLWFIGIVAIGTLLYFLMKGARNTSPSIRQQTRVAKERGSPLPDNEKDKLSAEIRETALAQYDLGMQKARGMGMYDAFAHQLGVFSAVSSVINPAGHVSAHNEYEIQMETVPFNKLLPDEGRQAVAEYLVYKFFPDRADESLFSPALATFYNAVAADAKDQPKGFMFEMIYCVKYDWQRYITAMPV